MATELKVGMKVRATHDFADITKGREYEIIAVDPLDDGMPIRVRDNVGDGWWLKARDFEPVEPAPDTFGSPAPKFKVGDRVRTKGYEGTQWDVEGTIVSVGICNIVEIDGERGGFFDHELELVATTTPPRLGRRYRTCSGVKTGPVQFGMEAEVDGHMRVYDKAGGHVFGKAELDLVEELPLVVRKGGYYRTRDGRKVGPMEMVSGHWSPNSGKHWYNDDGSRVFGDNDGTVIIAEWVDEPKSTKEILDDLEAWMAEQDASRDTTPTPSTTGFTVPLCAYEDAVTTTALGDAYVAGYKAGLAAATAQAAA